MTPKWSARMVRNPSATAAATRARSAADGAAGGCYPLSISQWECCGGGARAPVVSLQPLRVLRSLGGEAGTIQGRRGAQVARATARGGAAAIDPVLPGGRAIDQPGRALVDNGRAGRPWRERICMAMSGASCARARTAGEL